MKRLLAACGIGGARVVVVLEEQDHPRGANIHGTLILVGGAVSQRVERLVVSLVERAHLGKWNNLAVKRLRPAATVEPGAVEEHPFSLEVPDEARLSVVGRSVSSATAIVAVADIRRAVKPRAAVAVHIVPHREIVAIRRAMAALGFLERAAGGLKALPDSFAEGYYDSVVVRYDPPDSLKQQIQDVSLHLTVDRGVALCKMFVRRRMRSLKETLMDLTLGEIDPTTLRIPCRELRDLQGKPRPDGATDRLAEHLNRALASPDAVEFSLLRASTAPATATDELVRPAMPGQGTSHDDLLRPSDDDPVKLQPETGT